MIKAHVEQLEQFTRYTLNVKNGEDQIVQYNIPNDDADPNARLLAYMTSVNEAVQEGDFKMQDDWENAGGDITLGALQKHAKASKESK